MAPTTRHQSQVQSNITFPITKTSKKLKKSAKNSKPNSISKESVQSLNILDSETLGTEVINLQKALRCCDPSHLPGRENHIRKLEEHLYLCKEKQKSTSIYIFGSYGLGKTASLKILQNKQYTKDNFITIDINCKQLGTSQRNVFEKIISALSPRYKKKLFDLNMIRKQINVLKKPTLLILDELDELTPATISSLLELPVSTVPGKLVLIGVGNTIDCIEKIQDLKCDRSLVPSLLEYKTYTKTEIKDILVARLNSIPLKQVVFDEAALNFLAAKAESTGCVRTALGYARAAIERAFKLVMKTGCDKVCNVDPSVINAVTQQSSTKNVIMDQLVIIEKVIMCSAAILLKRKDCLPGNMKVGMVFKLTKEICLDKLLVGRFPLSEFHSFCNRLKENRLLDLRRKDEKTFSFDDKILAVPSSKSKAE